VVVEAITRDVLPGLAHNLVATYEMGRVSAVWDAQW